jgi:hypothetical protein
MSVAPTPYDSEVGSVANSDNDPDLESSTLLSPSVRSSRDSLLTASFEPPEFSDETKELLKKRGAMSQRAAKRLLSSNKSSRSSSRLASPAMALNADESQNGFEAAAASDRVDS